MSTRTPEEEVVWNGCLQVAKSANGLKKALEASELEPTDEQKRQVELLCDEIHRMVSVMCYNEEKIVKCIDNKGVETYWDEDEEYKYDEIQGEYIIVANRFGDFKEVSRKRFEVIKNDD